MYKDKEPKVTTVRAKNKTSIAISKTFKFVVLGENNFFKSVLKIPTQRNIIISKKILRKRVSLIYRVTWSELLK